MVSLNVPNEVGHRTLPKGRAKLALSSDDECENTTHVK